MWALREIRSRSGIGYHQFPNKGKLVVQRGEVLIADPEIRDNPLPRTSLHRAIRDGQTGWFGAEPARLAVFLQVAGYRPDQVGAWLARLAEIDHQPAAAPDPPADPASPDRPPGDRPPAGRSEPVLPGRAGRRWVRFTSALLIGIAVIFLMVLASYAQFYGALGFDVERMPVSATGLVLSTCYAALATAGVMAVLSGAFATGALLVPWANRRSRAVVPASALSTVVAGSLYLSTAVVPISSGIQLGVVLVIGYVWFGLKIRLISSYPVTAGPAPSGTSTFAHNRRALLVFTGLAIGMSTALLLWRAGLLVGGWSHSRGWMVATILAGGAAVAVPLGRWLRAELRRDGWGGAGLTRPATLLAQLRDDVAPSIPGIMRSTMASRDARRLAAGLAVIVVAAPVALVVVLTYLIGPAADAGAAALEHGYVPPERGTPLIWSPPVVPATVTPRRPGADPEGVCDQARPWAASAITRDPDGSWVLLRPVGAGDREPQVVWLAAGDYTVRAVLDPAARNGGPWTRPACG